MAHSFSPSIWEAEVGRCLSLRLVWSMQQVPGQPGLSRKTLSQNSFILPTFQCVCECGCMYECWCVCKIKSVPGFSGQIVYLAILTQLTVPIL